MKTTYTKLWHRLHKGRQRRQWTTNALALLIIFTVTSITTSLYVWEMPLSSPLSDLSKFRFLRTSLLPFVPEKMVYGFIPYWNINDLQLRDELTRIGYFSLTIGADGSLLVNADGEFDPGYNTLKGESYLELAQNLQEKNIPSDIVLTQFNSDDITAFLGSNQAQRKLLAELDSVLLAYPFTGVNIDIEYNGTVTPQLQKNMTLFVELLSKHLDATYDSVELSIDVYASAAENTQIWDIEPISQSVDYIIVMAYDFHRRSSQKAGPVAPLFGADDVWSSDINTYMQTFLEMVPAQKLVLGIPFYGYEWQTTSRDPQAFTFPNSGATATLKRVKTILERSPELQVQEHWSEAALSPFISYVEDGETFIVYYENERSIGYKLDYVRQLDLKGIAIWALGYEGADDSLWKNIGDNL